MPEPALVIDLRSDYCLCSALPLARTGLCFSAAGVFAAVSASNFLGFFYAARLMKRSLATSKSSLAGKRPIDDYIADWRVLAGGTARRAVDRTDAE